MARKTSAQSKPPRKPRKAAGSTAKKTKRGTPHRLEALDVLAAGETILEDREARAMATPTESDYEALQNKILPLLGDSALTDLSAEQIRALSEQAKLPAEQLEELVVSARLARDARLPAELIFGLGRQGLRADLPALLEQPPRKFRELLDRAAEENQIPRLDASYAGAVDRLAAMAMERTPLASLLADSGARPSEELLSNLAAEGIANLADLRRTGGLGFRDDLNESDLAAATHLDAQARLLTLHPDPALTADLIKSGYSSIAAVARAEPVELAAALGRAPDAPIVRELIQRGKAQHALIQSFGLGYMGSHATGIHTVDEWHDDHPIHSLAGDNCSCRDCDAAVSPHAYLADLMQYAIDHLRDGVQEVDLAFFESHFYQPSGRLPSNCQGTEEQVRQARICVEVLRAYLGARPLADAARESGLRLAEERYRLEVYQAILIKLGTNLAELRLAQGAAAQDRQALADRIGIAEAALAGMYFDPTPNTGQLTEQALEREFGLIDTTRPPLRNVPIAVFINARRYFLRQTWRRQDFLSDAYSERTLPIIDPDILGPDDFRTPYQKTNAADPDRAFDLWVARREWADSFLQTLRALPARQSAGVSGPDLPGIVAALDGTPYQGQVLQWPAAALSDIQDILASMTSENSEVMALELYTNYRISVDAARRLVELWEKDETFWNNLPRAAQLEEAEWTDVFAILLRAVKNSLADFWIGEEVALAEQLAQANDLPQVWVDPQDASQALFGGREFWMAVREPVEGEWPPVRTGAPLVDPELVRRDDLPEPVAGRPNPGLDDVRTIWQVRAAELADEHQSLVLALETAGFEAMLTDALGAVPAPAAAWDDYLHALEQDLSGDDVPAAAAATVEIEQTLGLTVEAFQRVVNVMDRQAGVANRPLPGPVDLEEVFAILVSRWKVRTRYSDWLNEETQAGGYEPWRCRRHALAKWRATLEERQLWQRSLAERSRAPLIDPDLLASVSYLKTLGGGAAWTVWDARQKAIAAKFGSLRAAPRTLAGLNQIADAELGADVLAELGDARNSGGAALARLQQVDLSFKSLNKLLQVRDLLSLAPGQPVLDAEWDAVASILTQVWKDRRRAEWLLEERAQDLFLSPNLFRLLPVDLTKFPPPALPRLDEWRGSREILSDWEDRLRSRIDQDGEVAEAVHRAVGEAEEQALPALRDALVSAAAPVNFSFAQSSQWLGDHLAIATEYDGCHMTTRISQAIETFQGLLWGVRIGIFKDQYPNLRLVGDSFDEEWAWIGSYGTWRAAMFVWLYPENILLPSLRRVQTPPFQELVGALRDDRQLTSEGARRAAEKYAEYFRDVCSLELKAACTTLTATSAGERSLQYLFAMGGETGALYWCVYDAADGSGYPLSFWNRVKGLEGKTATVVGADSYRIFARRYLYLFLIVESEGERELAFTRYDLRSRSWDQGITALGLPDGAGTFAAALFEPLDEQNPPTLAIRASNGTFYQRSLDRAGRDWAVGQWSARDRLWGAWLSATSANTDSPATLANATHLKAGSRFYVAQHATDPSVTHLVCVGWDGQAYGFRLNGYRDPERLENFNAPGFAGVQAGEGGITGVARNGLLPNTNTLMPQIDLFAVASDQRILSAHWDMLNGWAANQWAQIGAAADRAAPNSMPAVAARDSHNLDVFIAMPAANPGRASLWKSFGRGTNFAWVDRQIDAPANYYSQPAMLTVFSSRASRLDVILNIQSTDPSGLQPAPADPSTLAHLAWTGGAAFANAQHALIPESNDVSPQALAVAAVRTQNLFDIFVPRKTREIWMSRGVINGGWSEWVQIGDQSVNFPATAQISTLTRSANHVSVFACDEHGQIDINGVAQTYGVIHSSWQRYGTNSNEWYPWAPVNFPPSVIFKPGGYVAPVLTREPILIRTRLRLFAIDLTGVLRWAESMEALPVRELPVPSFVWKPKLPAGTSLSDLTITERLIGSQRLDRPIRVKAVYAQNQYASRSISAYLEEMFYFVPLQIALELQKSGAYLAALDWFRLVYDYTALPAFRELVGMPPVPATVTDGFERNLQNWLLDPLNPHSIAATRRGAYARYTLMAIISCLLDYADSEFTQDTSETVPRARELYETVLELLNFDELKQGLNACEETIGKLSVKLQGAEWQLAGQELRGMLENVSSAAELETAVSALNLEFARQASDEDKYRAVLPIIEKLSAASETPLSYTSRLARAQEKALRLESAVLARPEISTGLQIAMGAPDESGLSKFQFGAGATMDEHMPASGAAVPATLAFDFCVPANPMLRTLRLRAEINLYKINNCLNIAGMERQIEPFAAATDRFSGAPAIGAGGQLTLPGVTQSQVTVYRYGVLIDRAKQLVEQALQIESAFLAALEKSDKEAYDLLTARGNIRLTQAGVRLKDLQMLDAREGIRAAELQRARAEIQSATYESWLQTGMTKTELTIAESYNKLMIANAFGTAFSPQIMMFTSSVLQAAIQRLQFMASFERRVEEFTLQKALADQDTLIAEQQMVMANSRVRLTEQERVIEQLRLDQAKEGLDFLQNKFTNKELYDWMGNVLEGVYRVLLQQATALARLAADQLAFERQEPPPAYIQNDYWQAPLESATVSGETGQTRDRRGLTGSARLLQDISQLDQYAFETNRRKQQLSRTISLAGHDPLAFQQFLQTGVLPFMTPMNLFDRDFPGHYLRLIKRVRISVVALIPPAVGIRATLTSSGLSRVVTGGDLFQTIAIRRPPDVVSLSSPANASGVFELNEQPEMLLPFEGQGVATTWEFALPKAANPFDFSTIADVLVTIDYTALSSSDYRQQVVQLLNAKRADSQDHAFSFRYNFSDAWYDLHNPELTPRPMSVSCVTLRADFPPNLDNLRIENVALYIAGKAGQEIEFENVDLRLTQTGAGVLGGISRTDNGLISTRTANGAAWLGMRGSVPVGVWQLTLPDTEQVRQWFKSGSVTDILLIVTLAGRLPEWPV